MGEGGTDARLETHVFDDAGLAQAFAFAFALAVPFAVAVGIAQDAEGGRGNGGRSGSGSGGSSRHGGVHPAGSGGGGGGSVVAAAAGAVSAGAGGRFVRRQRVLCGSSTHLQHSAGRRAVKHAVFVGLELLVPSLVGCRQDGRTAERQNGRAAE